MVEALRIFDHYHFRVLQRAATKANRPLVLVKPPQRPGEAPWWQEDYTVAHKIRDRELVSRPALRTRWWGSRGPGLACRPACPGCGWGMSAAERARDRRRWRSPPRRRVP